MTGRHAQCPCPADSSFPAWQPPLSRAVPLFTCPVQAPPHHPAALVLHVHRADSPSPPLLSGDFHVMAWISSNLGRSCRTPDSRILPSPQASLVPVVTATGVGMPLPCSFTAWLLSAGPGRSFPCAQEGVHRDILLWPPGHSWAQRKDLATPGSMQKGGSKGQPLSHALYPLVPEPESPRACHVMSFSVFPYHFD